MSATSGPVTVDYTTSTGEKKSIDCELLVIACDPRPMFGMAKGGSPVMQPTPTEKEVFAPMTDFIFQTTLVTVDVPDDPPKFGAILDPATAYEMKGGIGAFRNESAKQYGLDVANTLKQNHVVVYQLWGPESRTQRPSSDKLLSHLKKELPKVPWWPYGENFTVDAQQAPVHTPYLHRYTADQLKAGLPWTALEMQGENRTVYTWAGMCFESVLQCWQYQEMLLSPQGPNPIELPASLDAPIVIVGAGVSGLLMADRLRRFHGYTNVTMLEKEPQIGGKTHSVSRPGPHPDGDAEQTIAELGTCYLHPGYDELYAYLRPFWQEDLKHRENKRRGFVADRSDPNREFRGMVTTGTIKDPGGKYQPPPVVGYDEYIVLRAQQMLGWDLDPTEDTRHLVEGEIVVSLAEYAEAAAKLMGSKLPMPWKKPDDKTLEVLAGNMIQTWLDADRHLLPLRGLTGVLEYAYSIQGYGPLTTTPLYYGLVWISAIVAERLAEHSVLGNPNVTFWSKGWGDIWKRMAEWHDGSLVRGVTITSIDRTGSSGS